MARQGQADPRARKLCCGRGCGLQEDALPPEAVKFIHAQIKSVTQLEILLLLHGSDKALTMEQINESQRGNPAFIGQVLASLVAQGLVEGLQAPDTISYRYRPASSDLARGMDQLADLYSRYRVRIITAIYAEADPMQGFADAFRLRRGPESNG